MSPKLYEILVPCARNDKKPIRTRQHRVWDEKVREITGGLTIMPPGKGQWVCPEGDLFSERMIPVRIIATPGQMVDIVDMTAAFYNQKAVMYYVISNDVCINHYEQYILQNRYQDSGWGDLDGESFTSLNQAKGRAKELSKDAICYGMVRVVQGTEIFFTSPAGG